MYPNEKLRLIKQFGNRVFKYSGLKILYFGVFTKTRGLIKCPILAYHSISNINTTLDNVTPDLFEQHLRFISSNFETLTLKELYECLINDEMPNNPIVITFDDGLENFYEDALPIIEKLHVKATVFVITSLVSAQWEGRTILTHRQIKDIADRGIEIGSHTNTHANLLATPHEKILQELVKSKTLLENLLNIPVISIAFPWGSYNDDVVNATRQAGYKIAVTTTHDFYIDKKKLLECPRITVYPYDSIGGLNKKLDGDEHWLKVIHKLGF